MQSPPSYDEVTAQDTVTTQRRGDHRRTSYHRKTPSLSTYQTTDISKHYAVNQQILSAFESACQQKIYQVAYAVGMQFVETAVLEMPKHGYFYAARHETDRMKSALEAVRVTHILQQIQVDDDAIEDSSKRLDKLATLALEQVEQASHDQYESHRASTERDIRRQGSDVDGWVDCSEPFFLACQDSISSLLCPMVVEQEDPNTSAAGHFKPKAAAAAAATADESRNTDSLAIAIAIPVGRARTAPTLTTDVSDDWMTIPKPIDLRRGTTATDDIALEKALYLSGLEAVLADSVRVEEIPTASEVSSRQPMDALEDVSRIPPPPLTRHLRKPTASQLQLDVLSRLYYDDFVALQVSNRIRISYIDTYQGRIPASTNGCTVIAPVLCMHHLLEDYDGGADPGLCDAAVQHVIDDLTPAILSELRQLLGLAGQAFLIPVDVHDYLIGNGQLAQEQFVNVTGGNILDDQHLQHFIDCLARDEKSNTNGVNHERRLAATLFFHEHVVAILCLRRDTKTVWYDIIDSLPLQDTLGPRTQVDKDGVLSLRSSYSEDTSEDAIIRETARIRCLNADSLKACLRWYACSKFSEDNVSFIDMYAWDDAECDFDPRVFQAFIWGNASADAPLPSHDTTPRDTQHAYAEF